MKLHLLGYSESSLSRILDVLWMSGYRDAVTIIQNREAEPKYPYAYPGISSQVLPWDDWVKPPDDSKYLFSVTSVNSKRQVYASFLDKYGIEQRDYTTLIHPSAILSDTIEIGPGCFIEPGAIITSFAQLGFGVSVNRGVTIGHHTTLGDYVSLNPGVHVAGHCHIGDGTLIGMGACVFNGVRIGRNSIIGGGSIVTKDIPEGVIAWGNPCTIVKENVCQ
jgi:sugar O-acyltransferase (sialic acid O-acetyltransferase NeuD family)